MSERLKTLNERFNSFLNYETKSTILSLKEGMEEQDPTLLSYTAVFIEDPAEIKKLESIANQAIDTVVPKNAIDNTVWNFPSDYHMTVKLGRLALWYWSEQRCYCFVSYRVYEQEYKATYYSRF